MFRIFLLLKCNIHWWILPEALKQVLLWQFLKSDFSNSIMLSTFIIWKYTLRKSFPFLCIYSLMYIKTESWNLILFYNFNSLLTCILLSKLSPIWPVGFLSSWPLCPLCEASIIFQGLPYFIPQEYLWGIVCTLSVSEFPVYIMPSLISKILKSHGPLPACLSYSLFFLTTPTPHPLEFHMHTSLSSKLPFLEELKH